MVTLGHIGTVSKDKKTLSHHCEGKTIKSMQLVENYSYSNSVSQFASSRITQSLSPKEKPLSTLIVTTSTIKKTRNHSRPLSNSHSNCFGKQAPRLKVVIVLPWPRALSLANKTEDPRSAKQISMVLEL